MPIKSPRTFLIQIHQSPLLYQSLLLNKLYSLRRNQLLQL